VLATSNTLTDRWYCSHVVSNGYAEQRTPDKRFKMILNEINAIS